MTAKPEKTQLENLLDVVTLYNVHVRDGVLDEPAFRLAVDEYARRYNVPDIEIYIPKKDRIIKKKGALNLEESTP